ncbi:unnamed protein product, partial [marine sediment metagenome]
MFEPAKDQINRNQHKRYLPDDTDCHVNHINLGEISTYPKGYKENAGVFCHNNPWIMIAETILGNGDRAF